MWSVGRECRCGRRRAAAAYTPWADVTDGPVRLSRRKPDHNEAESERLTADGRAQLGGLHMNSLRRHDSTSESPELRMRRRSDGGSGSTMHDVGNVETTGLKLVMIRIEVGPILRDRHKSAPDARYRFIVGSLDLSTAATYCRRNHRFHF